MINIFVLGLSDHSLKKVIPSLESANFKIKGIISRKDKKTINKIVSYKHYSCLEKTDALDGDFIYISTPIGLHFDDVKRSLDHGFNVICEKILTPSFDQTTALFKLAKDKSLSLFEVDMYRHHPQFKVAKNIINEKKYNNIDFGQLISSEISFEIPHLEKNNFRYKKELGGGAIFDIGFYPISALVSLFDKAELQSKTITYADDGVDLTGKVNLKQDDISIELYWGLGCEYKNTMILKFDKALVLFERFFSKPLNFEAKTKIILRDSEIEHISNDNHFKSMLINFINFHKNEEISHINRHIERSLKISKLTSILIND